MQKCLTIIVMFYRSFCVCLNMTGWLVDWPGEFSAVFYLAGPIFVVMVNRLVEKKHIDLVKVADAAADTETCQINGKDHLEVERH